MIEVAIDIDNALLKNPDRFIPLLNKVNPRYILIASSRDLETPEQVQIDGRYQQLLQGLPAELEKNVMLAKGFNKEAIRIQKGALCQEESVTILFDSEDMKGYIGSGETAPMLCEVVV